MSYAALISAWNSASQASGATLPSGAIGTLLTGLTTAQKIAAVNAWTVAGAPTPCVLTPSQIFNCIDTVAHANALTTTQLQIMQFLAGSGQPISAPAGSLVRSWFTNTFAGQTTTLANFSTLIATFDSPAVLWVTAASGGGLSGFVSLADTQVAGLT